MTAYATAFYINQRILHSPHYWTKLLFSMAVLTAAALAIIRVSYFETLGRPDPDPDPYGACRHYLIDLFGMAVHVAGFAKIYELLRRSK